MSIFQDTLGFCQSFQWHTEQHHDSQKQLSKLNTNLPQLLLNYYENKDKQQMNENITWNLWFGVSNIPPLRFCWFMNAFKRCCCCCKEASIWTPTLPPIQQYIDVTKNILWKQTVSIYYQWQK